MSQYFNFRHYIIHQQTNIIRNAIVDRNSEQPAILILYSESAFHLLERHD